ncbi:MAG: hypothetical protein KAQ71_06060 [Desulfobulbaceae bacterium]|nr:hypothetical protein [Desulfobulbaceae bacterium]
MKRPSPVGGLVIQKETTDYAKRMWIHRSQIKPAVYLRDSLKRPLPDKNPATLRLCPSS